MKANTSEHRAPASSAGFTLFELLVTITILGVLAAIAYKVGTSAIQRAWIVQSSANLKSLAAANAAYQADHGEFCPADDRFNNLRWHGARTSVSSKFDPTEGFLSPYLGKSRTVNTCPIFKNIVSGSASFEEGTGGYGYNSAYIGGRPGGAWNKATKIRIPAKMEILENPSETVMFTTTAYAQPDGLQEYASCEPPFWDFGNGPSGERPSPTVHFRAEGKAIVVWCDGHVTLESNNKTMDHGENPHGGKSESHNLGWFGPEDNNGHWNTRKSE